MPNIIGVIAALPEEADALFPGLGETRDNVRVIPLADRTIIIATSGIGKVNATLAASRLVITHHAEMLFVIGTAGALGDRHAAFLLTEAIQIDYGARRGNGFAHYRAGDWPIGGAAELPFAAMAIDSPLPHARIATGDAFVECTAHAAYLRDTLECEHQGDDRRRGWRERRGFQRQSATGIPRCSSGSGRHPSPGLTKPAPNPT
jgi:adenosylhomocysteine nucleosidase